MTTSGYGAGGYGAHPIGGGAPATMTSVPYLVSSFPADGTFSIDPESVVTFTVASTDTSIDETELAVDLDGEQAIVGGSFLPGYSGTIETDGLSGAVTVTFTEHPVFQNVTVYCVVYATDAATHEATLVFRFGLDLSGISELLTKTWCDGNRIDLFFTVPAGATQVRIRRSSFSYCRFIDDPGEDVYDGAVVGTTVANGTAMAYVDGPGPVPASYPTGTTQSTTALQPNSFYYYTVFISYTTAEPYLWLWLPGCQVEGLSIKPYTAMYGDYIYTLLPSTYRKRDADPSRGSDQYLMRDYCGMLQCAVNLYRGWMEAIPLLNDPDSMPAGRVGDTGNTQGLLAARVWGLGLQPEQSFDAAVLRRIAIGLIAVMKQKGTCPGLVSLTKMLTTWDASCQELIDPVCGINTLLMTYDGTSRKITVTDYPYTPVAGSITLPVAAIGGLNPSSAGGDTVAFIIDAMGTFVCVESVGDVVDGSQTLTFADPTAVLRAQISGVGTSDFLASTFTIQGLLEDDYPWQFPYPADPPVFGSNAWAGYWLSATVGTESFVCQVSSSEATDGNGDTVLNVSAHTIPSFSGVQFVLSKTPPTTPQTLTCTLYVGEFSFLYSARFDPRLLADREGGPWSEVTALGSTDVTSHASTPADVAVWVHNVAQAIGTLTGVADTEAEDSTRAWSTNAWIGYYLLPNWGQTQLYRIVANDSVTLVVDATGEGGVADVAVVGSTYVILTEMDALMYSRLVRALSSFVPLETRPLVKFDSV